MPPKFSKAERWRKNNPQLSHYRNGSRKPTRESACSQSESHFRDWQYKIPRDDGGSSAELRQKLPEFFQQGWRLFNKGTADVRQQIIKLLASHGGLLRISEATQKLKTSHAQLDSLILVKNIFLPILNVITHDTAVKSPLLENYIGTIHTFLFGTNGERGCKLYPLLVAYAHSKKGNTVDGSKEVMTILTFLHKAVDINSTAKVTEPLFPVIESLSGLISDNMPDAADGRYIIDRIRRRMGLGQLLSIKSSIDTNKASKKLPGNARFVVSRDLPGSLSPSGPRYDNDHENIADIQIMPTTQEIESSRLEYLPVHDPALLHKPGLAGLIDRQFRLLREDTVGQLRNEAQVQISRLKKPPDSHRDLTHEAHARKTVYSNVRLEDIDYNRLGLYALISFDQPNFLRRTGETQRRQFWERSKSLGVDALVCILSASGRTDFMSVCLESPVNDDAANEKRIKRLSKDQYRASTLIRLVEPHEYNISRLASSLSLHQESIELCEFPGVLLPSFSPTLTALKGLSSSLDLPFSDLIAPDKDTVFNGTVSPPRYAMQPHFSFSLQAIAGGANLSLSPRQPFDYKALEDCSPLDQAQQVAVVEALTRSLSLIQGPPGTGKSYTGVALIKVLLDNAKKASLGPIVCVCYTNHALDQLLEHLVNGGIEQVIRIGSQSKSEMLKPLNLREVAKNGEQTTAERRAYWENMSELENVTPHFRRHREAILKPGRLRYVKEYLQQENVRQFEQLFPSEKNNDRDEDRWSVVQRHDDRNELEKWLKPRNEASHVHLPEGGWQPRTLEQLCDADIWTMTISERKRLLDHWLAEIRANAVTKCAYALDGAKVSQKNLNRVRQESDLRCLNHANVIGLTTSGLARNLSYLRHLRSKVLVCEEAGEVLEAHLLTALLPSIEHAILIGDHQQLRPQIQNYELQSDNPRGQQYSLDVSLFERLVQPTVSSAPKLPLSDLRTQRRMHPSISQLIRKTLYPYLQDDPSAGQYPPVEGIARRLFWINHRHPENNSDKEDSTSYSNDYEIGMTAALVSHLVRQGKYRSDEIAVITPYLGQFIKLRRKLGASFTIMVNEKDTEELDRQVLALGQMTEQASNAERGTLLQALRIATVDNFQGEEAKVIIVSLVRSNKERRCGFLRTSNRINVLLSRAQHGMYLIGDAETYQNIDMWGEIIQMLENGQNIGPSLTLCCPRHPDTIIEVSSPDDFSVKAPEGGCKLMCEWRLECGHNCINKCHSRLLHQNVICQEPCPRSRSGCDHPCENKCGYPCSLCVVKVHNVQLPCGHVAIDLPCHLAQDPSRALCSVSMDRTIPGCNHLIKRPCHEGLPPMDMRCWNRCSALLPCGHECMRICSKCNEKAEGQIVKSDHGACQRICERQYNTCGHRCKEKCHGDKGCPLCSAPCDVRCSHSKCGKSCCEPCVPCSEQCAWSCPHRGNCTLPCAVPCYMIPCSKRCEKTLDCGHQCPSMCGEACPSTAFCQTCCNDKTRGVVVDYIMSSVYAEIDLNEDPILVPHCGHMMTVSSMDGHLGMGNHFEMSDEGHPTTLKGVSQPFSSEDLKNCPICRHPIRNINRYNRIIRRGLIDESTKKYITWSNVSFAPLAASVQDLEAIYESHADEAQLPDKITVTNSSDQKQVDKLHDGRHQFINYIRKVLGKTGHFKDAFRIRQEVAAFQRKVSDGEQPFGRIWDLVENERRRKGRSNDHFPFQADVLQPRSRLLASALAIRCDLAIISEFCAIRGKSLGLTGPSDFRTVKLDIDFSSARQECLALAIEAASKHQPLIEVEARIYFARFAALERVHKQETSTSTEVQELRARGLKQLDHADRVAQEHPGQVKGMAVQMRVVRQMLNDGTFYTVVTSQETQQVYAALSQEFHGTGHWYRCANGHPFTIGECGMPMETSRCPQCGEEVGGRSHRTVVGVTRDEAIERTMGGLTLDARG